MYPNNTKIIKTTTRHKSLQQHMTFYYQMLISINNYYTKIQKALTKYQSVERVTLFLLLGSFDLRTGHLAIL